MATNTSRLVLRKPGGSDNVNEVLDLNNNWDIVDLNAGFRVCTSATRPGTPYQGQQIYETDTKNRYYWSGTDWFLMNKKIAIKTADQTRNNNSALVDDDHLALSLDAGTWLVETKLAYTGPTAGDIRTTYTFSGTISVHRRFDLGPAGSGNDNQNTIMNTAANVAFSAIDQYAAAPGAGSIFETMILIVTAVGTLQLRWGQNIGTVGDTTIFTRSFMTAERVA